jgi:serine protease Do
MFPGFEEFFGGMPNRGGPAEPQIVRGEGSGFIIEASGLVLTNHHVVDGAESIRARFTDGTTAEMTLVGSDERTDVALLQLPKGKKWPYVQLAGEKQLEVGDWVIAVGNPLGLGTTVTAGIISGKGRDLPNGNAYDQFLQTDAAINQGNSGGPLFNLDGHVIGMNTAIIQGANTVGFAIPTHIIKRVRADLEQQGYVSRGFIGVSAQPMDPDLAKALGAGSTDGALVSKVYDGAPADGAGLLSGDIIVQIEKTPIQNPADLVRAVGEHHPGEKIAIRFIREGKQQSVTLKLAELPGSQAEKVSTQRPGKNTQQTDETLNKLGLELGALSSQLAAKAGVNKGVLIQSVSRGSLVDRRLQAGDILVQVNNRAVSSPREVSTILRSSRGMVSFLVIRGQRQMYIAVSMR